MPKRKEYINVLREGYDAKIAWHAMNVNILIDQGVGVADHPNSMETIQKELERIAYYQDLKNALKIIQ